MYKGHLPDGQVIAVKRLMKNEKDAGDRAGDFLTELGIIAHTNHPNATRLVGFGIDRGLYFVLEYAPHGSLASLLFGELLHPSISCFSILGLLIVLQFSFLFFFFFGYHFAWLIKRYSTCQVLNAWIGR